MTNGGKDQLSVSDTQIQPTRATSLQSWLETLRVYKLREIYISRGQGRNGDRIKEGPLEGGFYL